jgi:hypothetical protein
MFSKFWTAGSPAAKAKKVCEFLGKLLPPRSFWRRFPCFFILGYPICTLHGVQPKGWDPKLTAAARHGHKPVNEIWS